MVVESVVESVVVLVAESVAVLAVVSAAASVAAWGRTSRSEAPPEPFADLDDVLSLAKCDNIAIKISGACTLSHQTFPYDDIWGPLGKIFEAFGFDRCMWGTDWTRAVALLTYEQGVEAFRVTDNLSIDERSELMGGTLEKIYKWSPQSIE